MDTVASVRALLFSRGDLEMRDLSSRAIAAAVRTNALRRVHHGWYVESQVWDAAYPEQRHLFQVVAHTHTSGAPTLSGRWHRQPFSTACRSSG